MFYDVFINLCQVEKIAPSNLLKSLNLSTGNLQKWKDGATVNSDILITLSKHFGVTTDYLLGLNELSDDKKELLNLYDKLPERKKGEVTGFIKGILNEQNNKSVKRKGV